MTLNIARREALDVLFSRRSVKARDMAAPGPEGADLETILQAGLRVPDHGKLFPWRLFVFTGPARDAFGEAIREAYMAEEGKPTNATAKALAGYPAQAPVLVVLASTPSSAKPIPFWEQRLSAGACGMAMLTAAHSLGYVGQWITGWPSYSEGVKRHLGLGADDGIAGFIFFGSQSEAPAERDRPAVEDMVQRFATRADVLGEEDSV